LDWENIPLAGRIHAPNFRDFWVNTLKADAWVTSVILNGYKLPLCVQPASYREENNLSARVNLPYVRSTISKWLAAGVIEKTEMQPYCSSPLSVATRTFYNEEPKLRLCWDGSRHVNNYISKESVKLSDLPSICELIEPGDYLYIFDLKSAYFHIGLHPDSVPFMGFSCPDEDGQDKFYHFLCLAFGVTSAVFVMTRLAKPIIVYITIQNIRFRIYIDDGIVMAKSIGKIVQDAKVVVDIFKRCGFILAEEKSDSFEDVGQVKRYLGLVLDTSSMSIAVPANKLAIFRATTVSLLNALQQGPVPVRSVARFTGLVVSMSLATGKSIMIRLRIIFQELQSAVALSSWNGKIALSSEAVSQIRKISKYIDKHHIFPMPNHLNALEVRHIIPKNPEFHARLQLPLHWGPSSWALAASDASDSGAASFIQENGKFFLQQSTFSTKQASFSSGQRELLAVVDGFPHMLPFLPKERPLTLYWATDSSNLSAFLEKGSRKADINEIVLNLLEFAQDHNITIVPILLRREHPLIQEADWASRVAKAAADEWYLPENTRDWIISTLVQPTLEVFASPSNHFLRRYFSKTFHTTALAVNAFAQSWSGETVWACPPVSLAIATLRKFKEDKTQGILILPEWKSQPYWAYLLHLKNQYEAAFVKSNAFTSVVLNDETTMRGVMHKSNRVNFMALMINFEHASVN